MFVRSVLSWRLLVLGPILFCLAACGTGAGQLQPGFAERQEAPGIDNFARIKQGVFRGAQPDAFRPPPLGRWWGLAREVTSRGPRGRRTGRRATS